MMKKNIFYGKKSLQPDFCMKQNALQARLVKLNAPQAKLFD